MAADLPTTGHRLDAARARGRSVLRGVARIAWSSALLGCFGCGGPSTPVVEPTPSVPPLEALQALCSDAAPAPGVEEVVPNVFVARGYDLANTIVVRTKAGNVVVDVGTNPTVAARVKADVAEVAPGPTVAVILTHSHVDHVGGGSAWVEPGTEVWGTRDLADTFWDRYGVYRKIESLRAARQFGRDVAHEDLPCSAIGSRLDVDGALSTGARLPTKTFSGEARFVVGGTTFVLVEAPGETEDQLFVHLPDLGVLLPGDNWYHAFPNLYTIRGTRPRSVSRWIASLDAMRAREPEVLIPSHTAPVRGKESVAAALTAHRDAIQWVRDQVVRGANQGWDIDRVAAHAALPPDLAAVPSLAETYGQVDWSARAIFDAALGWFDGRVEELYPLHRSDIARRRVQQMGGAEAVRAAVEQAISGGDHEWALVLLRDLEDAGVGEIDGFVARAARGTAEDVVNTNGRGWLLQVALEREGVPSRAGAPVLDDATLDSIPAAMLVEALPSRLIPERAEGIHESIRIVFTDVELDYTLTVRNGVLEIVEGDPLPGTPASIAVARVTAGTWRRLALGRLSPAKAVASGKLKVDRALQLKRFMDRFDVSL